MNYTKAEMLKYLKENLSGINILPIYIVYSNQVNESNEKLFSDLIEFSCGKSLIVRSSSILEDTEGFSNAGKFESILNVSPTKKSIYQALSDVYKSYNTDTVQQILV